MSQFYDRCDLIKQQLETSELLKNRRIVVDRQLDIASELKKVIGKQVGDCIIVAWAGSNNTDTTADGPRFESNFTVTYCAKPVLRKGDTAADDVCEEIAKVIHDFRPNEFFHDRLVVSGITPVPLGELILYRVNITTPSQM